MLHPSRLTREKLRFISLVGHFESWPTSCAETRHGRLIFHFLIALPIKKFLSVVSNTEAMLVNVIFNHDLYYLKCDSERKWNSRDKPISVR